MFTKLKDLKARFAYSDDEMPFLEHLEEFRKTVIRSLSVFVVGAVICGVFFVPDLVAILRAPAEPYIDSSRASMEPEAGIQLQIDAAAWMHPEQWLDEQTGKAVVQIPATLTAAKQTADPKKGVIRLQFSEPAAAVKMWIMVAVFGGLLLSLPFLVFIVGSFVMPGIRAVERQAVGRISVFSGALFLLGVSMGYKVTLPVALGLMLRVGGQLGGESIWFYNKYIAFTLQLLLGFGLAFQLPVIILILGKMGILNARQLREKRRHVIVGLLVLAMILTPPDVVTQLLMAAPLILLYEFCIWFLYFGGNRGASSEVHSETRSVNNGGSDSDNPEMKE